MEATGIKDRERRKARERFIMFSLLDFEEKEQKKGENQWFCTAFSLVLLGRIESYTLNQSP